MVSDRAFIFHIYISWGKALSFVPKSGSHVKVKYQGHRFGKNGRCGGIRVSQTHLVSLLTQLLVAFYSFLFLLLIIILLLLSLVLWPLLMLLLLLPILPYILLSQLHLRLSPPSTSSAVSSLIRSALSLLLFLVVLLLLVLQMSISFCSSSSYPASAFLPASTFIPALLFQLFCTFYPRSSSYCCSRTYAAAPNYVNYPTPRALIIDLDHPPRDSALAANSTSSSYAPCHATDIISPLLASAFTP